MSRILITGATSFIGQNLIRYLGANEIIAVVRPNSNKLQLIKNCGAFELCSCDMCDYDRLPFLINGSIDVFIHLAWDGTRGQARNDEELQKKNFENSKLAVDSAIKLGAKVFIVAGSQAEYGPWTESRKITENDTSKPNTEYGISKLKFAEYAEKKCMEAGVRFLEPRFFSLYGPGDSDATMVVSVLRSMIENAPCKLTECTQLWDFLFIDDAVRGVIALLNNKTANGVYNIGYGESHELRYFIELMYKAVNSSSELQFGAVPYPLTGKVNINPDVTKLKQIGWKPIVCFNDGINLVIDRIQGNAGKNEI